MNVHEAPRSKQQHISIQQIGTETLLYDERRHKAYCLNRTSSVVWGLADGKHTVAQITAAASIQLQSPVSEELVLFALEELRRDGLIEPSSTSETGRTFSRRVILQRLGVGGAMLLPIVAAIVAPTAAQAYSGCFDCATSPSIQAVRARQFARGQQLRGSSTFTPFTSPGNGEIYPPYQAPGIGPPLGMPPE